MLKQSLKQGKKFFTQVEKQVRTRRLALAREQARCLRENARNVMCPVRWRPWEVRKENGRLNHLNFNALGIANTFIQGSDMIQNFFKEDIPETNGKVTR